MSQFVQEYNSYSKCLKYPSFSASYGGLNNVTFADGKKYCNLFEEGF